MRRYTDALCAELLRKPEGLRVSTVFIGGGTPSVLPADCITRILRTVREHFHLEEEAEVTLEANPGTLSYEKLQTYIQYGINRLSLGAQALQDPLLRGVGRTHSASDVKEALDWAFEAGISNINVDVMAGLPGQDVRMMDETIRQLRDWGVPHVSLYALTLEEETPLYQSVKNGEIELPPLELSEEILFSGQNMLRKIGYEQYEISNFCRNGQRSRHNVNYWRCGEYIAAGIGASGANFVDDVLVRTRNEGDFQVYLRKIEQGEDVAMIEECVDKLGQMFEYIMLGLRMGEGISLSAFSERFGWDAHVVYGEAIDKHIANSNMVLCRDALRLSERGLAIQNTVLMDFML